MTFLTGVAPQQHACTGWYMNLKELGTVSILLRSLSRYGGVPFSDSGIDINNIINQETF
ncbi:MAG: hypothetical protein ACOYT4_03865 [Nanoarchaeota archaeon]